MRLAKYLAQAGIASRRHAEQIIKNGAIKLNGQIVTEIGTQVEPGKDIIEYQGKTVDACRPMLYVLLNKPAGFICSVNDPQGRPVVLDLLKDIKERIYPVGRLDFDTAGLLILTNDGEFTNLMIHPRYEIKKKYAAWVRGLVSPAAISSMSAGLMLEDGMTAPAEVKIIAQDKNNSLLEIIIHEGRKRQVKRMCAAIGHPVVNLQRTGLAFLSLQGLKEGQYRLLEQQEIDRLKDCAGSANRD